MERWVVAAIIVASGFAVGHVSWRIVVTLWPDSPWGAIVVGVLGSVSTSLVLALAHAVLVEE